MSASSSRFKGHHKTPAKAPIGRGGFDVAVSRILVRVDTKSREGELSRARTRMRELRGGDAALPGGKP